MSSHLVRAAAVLVLSLLTGCASCGPATCKTSGDCAAGQICAAGRCQTPGTGGGSGGGAMDAGQGGGAATGGGGAATGGGGGTTATLTGLDLTPASTTLQSLNGSQPTQQLTATGHFSDGSSRPVLADFTVDALAIGTVDPNSGLFTASGLVGGLVTVRAEFTQGATLAATATIEVMLERVVLPTGAPADLPTRFAGSPISDVARQADVVYPLDGVVFPQNVAPADVQWLTGTTGDWFRVRLTKQNLVFTSYVQEDGNHHLQLETAGWRALAQTNPVSNATLDVVRWEASTQQLIATPQKLMRFATASLVGSVYYWDIARGRIVRIDDGTTSRTEFMPSPPLAVGGGQCVGCHAVSPSGRYMAGRLGPGDNIGGIFDLTTSLTANPAPTVWPVSNVAPETGRWWFASFSPDETRLVVSQNETLGNQALAFMDPRNGQFVSVSGIPAMRATHPAWSPDGTKIAWVSLANAGEWGGSAASGDLWVAPFANDALGTPTQLHAGSALAADQPAGAADSYPTWTPDSKWLAFGHGGSNRSEGGTSALYLMKADGSEVRRLHRASGGPSTSDTFQPRFSPFKAGGYYWVSYLSRRNYGNAQVGTRGTNRQQIWVSAVTENPQPGADSSEVGYWLPGQNTQSQNIAAYWAPRPCRPAGASCTVGSECCSGDCRMNNGSLQCSPPPPERCRREGETCGGTGDCCPNLGLVCSMNVCILDIQ
ncbi:MAG: hypothetical protein U0228_17515 [Myxococcaceae bacterium]